MTKEKYFPRADSDWPQDHEPIATTKWPTQKEIVESFEAQKGQINPFIFGKLENEEGASKYLSYDDDAGVVTIAGTRVGKQVSLITPNLLAYKGPTIVLDMKGESASTTAEWRKENLNQDIVIIDSYKETRFQSNTINPLMYFDYEDDEFIDDITELADSLIIKNTSSSADPHWDESAQAVIKMILIYIVMDHDESCKNLLWLRKLILKGQSKSEMRGYQEPEFSYDDSLSELENEQIADEIFEQIKQEQLKRFRQFLINLLVHDHDTVSGTAQRLLDAGDKELGSVLSTVLRNTNFLDSPLIQKTLSGNDFDLRSLRNASVYLVLPERRLVSQSRFLRLLLSIMFRQLQADKKVDKTIPSALIVLDEANAIGHMEIVERAMGYASGLGIKMWTIWQDLSQLKANYPNKWETFLGNASIFTAFGNVDLTTQEYISKRCGSCETARLDVSQSGATSTSENKTSLGRGVTTPLSMVDGGGSSCESTTHSEKPAPTISPLLLPEEVGKYFGKNSEKILVLFGQGQPVYADRIIYYEDQPFKSRAGKSPFHI